MNQEICKCGHLYWHHDKGKQCGVIDHGDILCDCIKFQVEKPLEEETKCRELVSVSGVIEKKKVIEVITELKRMNYFGNPMCYFFDFYTPNLTNKQRRNEKRITDFKKYLDKNVNPLQKEYYAKNNITLENEFEKLNLNEYYKYFESFYEEQLWKEIGLYDSDTVIDKSDSKSNEQELNEKIEELMNLTAYECMDEVWGHDTSLMTVEEYRQKVKKWVKEYNALVDAQNSRSKKGVD